jgi:hypothetical protein
MVLQCAALAAIFLTLLLREPGWENVFRSVDGVRVILIWAMLAATALSGLQYLWRAAVLFRAV